MLQFTFQINNNSFQIGGMANERDERIQCAGSDNRKFRYLLVEKSENPNERPYVHRKCIDKCQQGFRQFINRCVKDGNDNLKSQNLLSKTGLVNFFQDISEDLTTCWKEIIYVCIISFVFSFIVLILFRFVVGFVVWIILIASVIAGYVASIYLWVKYSQKRQDPDYERVTTYLIAAILSTIATVAISMVIFVMRKRVKLVIQLFIEAGKALTEMPLLLFEPVLVFLNLN